MATKIRLQRHGRKDYAHYTIVVADSRAPRDGRFIERLGSYDPNTDPATIQLNFDRALYWVGVGAQPTDTAHYILKRAEILSWLGGISMPVYYLIPNTAISISRSMTFVAPCNANEGQVETIVSLFGKLGKVMLVEEKEIPACMALASCGIAYAMRYARANMEGAIEMGIKPAKALEIIEQTMTGAAELLATTGNHPEAEIDKVTTPGGLTIKGINTLEEFGFTTAVIKALKASV